MFMEKGVYTYISVSFTAIEYQDGAVKGNKDENVVSLKPWNAGEERARRFARSSSLLLALVFIRF